jgi:choline monooxygenase
MARAGTVDLDVDLSPMEHGFLGAGFYTSEDVFDLEMRSAFPRSWVFVGDVDEVGAPGQYLTATVGFEPILVVRGHDGELRAFHNVCRHRGTTLLTETGTCGKSIICPYHGWNYALDGRLTGVPFRAGFPDEVPVDRLGLKPVRVDTWERLVFVNVSGDAPPLLEYLEEIPTRLQGIDMSRAQRGHELDDTLDVNWKILVENGMEDYHLPIAHRKTLDELLDVRAFESRAWRYTGLVIAPPGRDARGAEEDLLAFSIFPNLLISSWPYGVTVVWWTPLSLTRTRARVRNYSFDPEHDPRTGEEGRRLMRQIQDEDFDICLRVQEGLRSASYESGPQHTLESRVGAFQQLLVELLVAGAERRA